MESTASTVWHQCGAQYSQRRIGSFSSSISPENSDNGKRPPSWWLRRWAGGRVVNVMTDSTWYWDFISTGMGADNRNYYKFWGNMIRWLIRDPSLRPLKISVDRDRYPLGAPVTATIQVFGRDYQPAGDAAVTVNFFSVVSNDLESQKPVKTIEGRTSKFGEFVVRFTPPTDGAWTVRAESTVTGLVDDTDVFVVATDPVELKDPTPRIGPLKLISRLSGRRVPVDE